MGAKQDKILHQKRRELQAIRKDLQARREAIALRRLEIEKRRGELEIAGNLTAHWAELQELYQELSKLQDEVASLQLEVQSLSREAERLKEASLTDELLDMDSYNLLRREHLQALAEATQTLREDIQRQAENWMVRNADADVRCRYNSDHL